MPRNPKRFQKTMLKLRPRPLGSFGTGAYLELPEYTLQDEARETSCRERKAWSRASQLRDRPVTFASAGIIRPFEPPEQESIDSNPENASNAPGQLIKVIPVCVQPTSRSTGPDHGCNAPLDDNCTITLTSESESIDSDDEIILFRGRGQPGPQNQCHTYNPFRLSTSTNKKASFDDNAGGTLTACKQGRGKGLSSRDVNHVLGTDSVRSYTRSVSIDGSDDAVMDDYIANLQLTGDGVSEGTSHFSIRYLDINLETEEIPSDIEQSEGYYDVPSIKMDPEYSIQNKISMSKSRYGSGTDGEYNDEDDDGGNADREMDHADLALFVSHGVNNKKPRKTSKRHERQHLRAAGLLGGSLHDQTSDEPLSLNATIQIIKTFFMGQDQW